ncbi:hypothetical protein HIM_07478 [Hirsutella minnesotensis 3608]|uniref:MutL C-terminal dimerisation domain-containing protein n=1 Tax=Hirsutella minnesotensis 3608 TaxID=1043627 RepID=A0A0F8A476_9HYPO|nr:hypothetical protein HIM_07478 [Hirsutella minnesotensis 3608]
MSIRQLPEDAVEKIKSSAAITSLNQVVAGLLKNALDAASTKVHVRVNYAHGNCTVEDDGLGIEPREFREDGGLGKRHYTSKFPQNPCFHGNRGDFLASVASLSLLSVASHHHRHVSQSFVSFHNSKVLTRQLPAAPEQRFETFSHGTRVTVRALFGSMPVRIKHQATTFSDRAGLDKEWSNLIREVVALLLAWPSQVSVLLTEGTTRRELRLKSTANIDVVTRTCRLFSQASLLGTDDDVSWVPVSASSRRIRVKGGISTVPAASRRSQMLSIGIQPILNGSDSNILYEAINEVFRNSSFGAVEDDLAESPPHGHAKPRKSLERWPMFYLQVMLPSSGVSADVLINSSDGVLTDTTELLKAVCFEFLKKHGMRPRKIASSTLRRSANLAKMSPLSEDVAHLTSKRSSARWETPPRESAFHGWNRVKVGWAASQPKKAEDAGLQLRFAETQTKSTSRLIGEGGKLLRMPFEVPTESAAVISDASAHTFGTQPAESAGAKADQKSSPFFDTRQPETLATEKRSKPEPSEWLQSIIQTWRNPVFETTGNGITSFNEATCMPAQPCHHGNGAVDFEAGSMSLLGRLSRSALADAEVIAQVDHKFILVRLPIQSVSKSDGALASSSLVMIDQHAADERCRLEALFRGYFRTTSQGNLEALTQPLEHPSVFESSGQEAALLERYKPHFAHWGIIYTLQNTPSATSPCRVRVTSLPPSIIERCRSEPRLLTDLLRKEIWALADGHASTQHATGREADTSWTCRFRGCPSGILELLYSRSCRSAIMFNDELSRDECVRLVQNLSTCAFPFQCAHGRPSMVPLVDLGTSTNRTWREGEAVAVAKWKKWMG